MAGTAQVALEAETKAERKVLAPSFVMWALQFLSGLASAPTYALLAVYVEKVLGQEQTTTAWLGSIPLALGGLSAPLAGMLADRRGYKLTFVWGTTSTIATCAFFLTGEWTVLLLLALYSGIIGSLQTTAGQAYLIHATGRERLGRASAGFFLGYTLGTSLGSEVAGRIADRFDFLVLGLGSSALAIAICAAGQFLLPPLDATHRAKPDSPRMSLSALLSRPEVRVLLAIRYFPTCYWGIVTLLVPLLIYRLSGTIPAARYSGVSLALACACQLWTGHVCDRRGLRPPLYITPIGISISAIGLTLGAHSAPALWIFGILGACSAWSLSITMPPLIDRVSHTDEKGRMVGMTALTWSAGMLSGKMLAGQLDSTALGNAHPELIFTISAVCAIVTIALALALARWVARRQAVAEQSHLHGEEGSGRRAA